MIKEIEILSKPQKADRVGPDGINGARHTPAALLTNYQRSVLRTFRELISDSDSNAALAGMAGGSTTEGRQLRPRSRGL